MRPLDDPSTTRQAGVWLRLALLVPVLALLLAFGTSPASAHAALDSITPSDGAVLTEAPEQIELAFNEPLLEASVKVVVTDSAGTVAIRDRSVVTGSSVTVPWDTTLPGGTYTIGYRVVSGDGHPITGQSTFELAIAPVTPSPAEDTPMPITPAPTASPATRAPTATAVSSDLSSPVGIDPVSEQSSSSLGLVIVALALGAAGGVAIVVWQRRRRT